MVQIVGLILCVCFVSIICEEVTELKDDSKEGVETIHVFLHEYLPAAEVLIGEEVAEKLLEDLDVGGDFEHVGKMNMFEFSDYVISLCSRNIPMSFYEDSLPNVIFAINRIFFPKVRPRVFFENVVNMMDNRDQVLKFLFGNYVVKFLEQFDNDRVQLYTFLKTIIFSPFVKDSEDGSICVLSVHNQAMEIQELEGRVKMMEEQQEGILNLLKDEYNFSDEEIGKMLEKLEEQKLSQEEKMFDEL